MGVVGGVLPASIGMNMSHTGDNRRRMLVKEGLNGVSPLFLVKYGLILSDFHL